MAEDEKKTCSKPDEPELPVQTKPEEQVDPRLIEDLPDEALVHLDKPPE